MASTPIPFEDFPDDVQLAILSFLTPFEIAAFACTSRRSASFCSHPKLWHSMCHRRWGSLTLLRCWAGGAAGSGKVPFDLVYRTLDRWENLIGFWRHVGCESSGTPPLLLFEWGPSFVSGFKVSPSANAGSYEVVKTPFLSLGMSKRGEETVFLHNGHRFRLEDDLIELLSGSRVSYPELVPVSLSFADVTHFMIKECNGVCSNRSGGDAFGVSEEDVSASPPDRLMSDIYQYFANRTSPGASRRQRKKEKERLGRWNSVAQHFVKITECCPTPSRPFQGLWKGICENMDLDFYLLEYDNIGGVVCRRIGENSEPFSGCSTVLWTSDATFVESPFPREEEDIYSHREHTQLVGSDSVSYYQSGCISRILCIRSGYSLVLPDLPGSSDDLSYMEGRLWEYKNGSFGFGFLQSDFIIDLKHISLNGGLLDAVEQSELTAVC